MDYWSNRMEWSFVLLSTLLPFILFSLSSSKLTLYMLPLFVPISLAIGRGLHWLVSNQKIRLSILKQVTFCTLIIIVAAKGGAATLYSSKDMGQLAKKLIPEITSFPQSPLYFVGNNLLYGLEFYLNGLLTRVPFDKLSETLQRDHVSGLVSLILIRNKDLPTLSQIIPGIGSRGQLESKDRNIEPPSSEKAPYQIKELDSRWVLIVWGGQTNFP